MKLETLCLHGGHQPDTDTLSRAVPIYRTSSFVFKNTEHAANLFALRELGNIYTRLMNPTSDVLERRVALLEGAPEPAGLAVASGTSAVFYSIINLAKAGDNIVSARNLYGGSYTQFNELLPALGIEVRMVDSNDPANFAAAIDENTRALFCESVSNPALEITDIAAVADVAHSNGAGIGGIVIDSGKFNWAAGKHPLFDEPDNSYHGLRWGHDLPDPLAPLAYILRMRTVPLRNLGACIAPDNSWIALQGIETLPLRMERHCENSLTVAKALQADERVDWVRYPGLPDDPEFEKNQKYLRGKGGAMVVFGIKGGAEAGAKFIDSLELISHLANVGDAKSLAIHPATTTHSQLSAEAQLAGGIVPELVRLSVGIENAEDILADIDQALAKAVE